MTTALCTVDQETTLEDLAMLMYDKHLTLVPVVEDGDGSACTYDATLSLNGPWRILGPLMALVFRRLGDRAATGLAEELGADGFERSR